MWFDLTPHIHVYTFTGTSAQPTSNSSSTVPCVKADIRLGMRSCIRGGEGSPHYCKKNSVVAGIQTICQQMFKYWWLEIMCVRSMPISFVFACLFIYLHVTECGLSAVYLSCQSRVRYSEPPVTHLNDRTSLPFPKARAYHKERTGVCVCLCVSL